MNTVIFTRPTLGNMATAIRYISERTEQVAKIRRQNPSVTSLLFLPFVIKKNHTVIKVSHVFFDK